MTRQAAAKQTIERIMVVNPIRPLRIGMIALSACLGLGSFTPLYGAPRSFLVVLDPGHGGKDHGAVYRSATSELTEKEITLTLAKKVAEKLRARDVRVVLTRVMDRELALSERTALANRLGADLFLSIHMNNAIHKKGRPGAEGVETYILNTTNNKDSKRIAELENKVSTLEGSVVKNVPQTDVALIVKDLILKANLGDSKNFACELQTELFAATLGHQQKKRNRGVKQALFYVLMGADMPSALVETGFLNSASDRATVTSIWGQNRISGAIAQAILNYRDHKVSPENQPKLSNCKVN